MTYDSTRKKLDKYFGSFLDKRLDPMCVDFKNSLTLYKNEDKVIILNTPTWGSITFSKKNESSEYVGGVIRCILSYDLCLKWIKDKDLGKYYLSLIKNEMLKILSEHFILSKDSTLSFKRPGKDVYFGSIGHPTAYELRLFFNKQKEVK